MFYCGMEVIKMPLFKSVQARKHNKKRINKKWLKKYGMKSVQIRPIADCYYTTSKTIFVPEELWGVFITAINVATS